jgi:2-polyprenyl-6-methoxyphenol hydroxylase-like FAD-dependent oxidoreductase
MTTVRTALVAGGGIAGPVVALALRRAGIEATVFEASTSPADGVGGTLAIAPNGVDALRTVGADEAVRAVGLALTRTVMADSSGRRLGEFAALSGLPPSLAVWRSDLQRALHERALTAGIEVVFGRRVVGADESDGAISARFADGGTATGDLLVGADGIRSTVRQLIDPAAPGPQHVPLLNFVGVAATAPAEVADASYFVFGRRAFLGYWSQPDGTTAWFANVPSQEPLTPAEGRRRPADDWLSYLREIYADDTPGRELLAHTDAGSVACLGSLEIMPKVPRWHRGRMVLVGDAVHAPSPSSGQGASLAAESAVELARCLRDCPGVTSALTTYESLRRRRVEKVAARAAKTNNAKAFGPFAVAMMRLMMPLAMRTFLTPERTLGPEQRHRIEWDRPVAAAAR